MLQTSEKKNDKKWQTSGKKSQICDKKCDKVVKIATNL